MVTISGSLSANGVSANLALGNTPEQVTLTLTGTFSAQVYLERALSTAALAWEAVAGPIIAPGVVNYPARPTDLLRVRVKNYVSGTVSYAASDGDATVRTWWDDDGRPLYRQTQDAHYFLGDLFVTGSVNSGNTSLNTFGNADFFRFGYGATRPLVKMQSAGTDATGAPQQVLSISHQVTHTGTGGAGAIGALYSASTIDGGPNQDYYAAAFTMTNRAKRDPSATPDQAQHGTLFTHQVKDLPLVALGVGEVMSDSWVQWWVMQDRTNLPSSKGGALVGVEFDIFGNNQDDAVGKKRYARQVVLNNYAGDAAHPLEWGYGDYWNSFTGGASDTFFNVVSAYYAGWTVAAIDLSQGTGARSNPYVDGVNRGVAIKMRDGAKLGFDGDGATGSYMTHGSSAFQWWAAGAQVASLSDAGAFTANNGLTSGTNSFAGVALQLNGSSASTRQIRWLDTGVLRAAMGMSGTAGDWVINRYLDTGTLKETAVTLNRRTGFFTATKALQSSDRVLTPKIQNSGVLVRAVTSLSGNGTTVTCGYTGGALPVGAQVRLVNNTPSAYDQLYIVATSTTNQFTALGSATGTVTELGSQIFYNPVAVDWTGATYPNEYAAFVQRYIPSGTPASGITAYNYYAISVDTVDATNTAGVPTAMRIDYNFGSAAMKSGRFGIHVNMNQAAAMNAHVTGGPIGGDFVPGAFHAQVSFNNGGTGNDIFGIGPNYAKGGVYALYPQIIANDGATYWDHFVGAEWDFQIRAGAVPNHKIGQHIVLVDGDLAQGVYDDIGFSFNGHPTVTGWRVGISFGRSIAPMGMDPAGTLIEIASQLNAHTRKNTLLHGINLRLGEFTGSAFTSTGGFDILGTGDMNVGPLAVTRTATAAVIDAKRYKVTAIAIASTGALYSVGDEIHILGGTLRVDTVSAGGVTGVTMIKDIYQDSPPANPQGGSGGGGGDGRIFPSNLATFNFTWTQITELDLQSSGGLLKVGGPVATPGPVTKTTNFTMAATETSVICNGAGSITVTLPAAASSTGQWRTLKTIAAQTVVSASSNVVPMAGGAAGTAILAATAGKWVDLQSDGTNWVIMRGN